MSGFNISTAGTGTTSPVTTSFATLPIQGDPVFVEVFLDTGTALAVTGVTDNQGVGNVYTKVVAASDGSTGAYSRSEIWWCQSIGATSGTFTVSVAFTPATVSLATAVALEAVNAATPAFVADQVGVLSTTSASSMTVVASAPNVQAIELVLAAFNFANFNGAGNGITYPPNTGYTAWYGVTTGEELTSGYKQTGALETSSASASCNTGGFGCAVLATFRQPGVVPSYAFADDLEM